MINVLTRQFVQNTSGPLELPPYYFKRASKKPMQRSFSTGSWYSAITLENLALALIGTSAEGSLAMLRISAGLDYNLVL